MSGRTRVVLSDGRLVRGYRKTLRRTRRRPVGLIRESGAPPAIVADRPSPDYPVRLCFLLPDSILVSPGPHGFNCRVWRSAAARRTVASRSPGRSSPRSPRTGRGFTVTVSVRKDGEDRTFGRHLTVVRGAVVISGGLIEPRVYEIA
jgi:hypothetical protein